VKPETHPRPFLLKDVNPMQIPLASRSFSARHHRAAPLPLFLVALFCCLLPVSIPVCRAAPRPKMRPASPSQVIHVFDQSLLKSMKAGAKAGFAGRYRILEPVIRRTIGWAAMLHLLTGHDWKELSPAERHRLRELFIRYTIANYAHEFNGYHGQRFHIVDHRHYPAYDLVMARFDERNRRHHTFVYLLQKAGAEWQIVNIFVDGVSNLSLLKSQFQFVLKKTGPKGLFDYLTRSISHLENPTGDHRSHTS
jgi:phospholipid transport system substrate-binding protein